MKQSFIASALGIDESGVSRMLSGEIGIKFEKLDALIDAMGMKLVAKDVVVVPAKELDSLRYLVGIYCEKRRGEK